MATATKDAQSVVILLLLNSMYVLSYSNGCSGEGNWSVYDRQCYSCIANAVPWQTARSSCLQLGADLVTINNAGTQSFVEKLCPNTNRWIGLNDLATESKFVWVKDSTAVSYSNWASSEPNNYGGDEDCVGLLANIHGWNDVPCTLSYPYICQKPEDCPLGSYGSNCSLNCSSYCQNKTCDRSSGECLHGCKPGYHMPNCVMPCTVGHYGDNCTKTCGKCLDDKTCNNVNGTCKDGCKEGFKGDLCITTCRNGTFGINCMYNCSGNCESNDICDKRNGTCVSCVPGWENQYCNKTCDVGSYGSNCDKACGRCLGAGNCSLSDGNCLGGCQEGFTGDNCHERIQNLHNTPDAAVIAAPVVAIVVLITVIVVVVILRKRQPS
ncbi:cell death abnormality protein 1 [Magallana gigas]|uniref:cell death abnormality protein 1 n=1 Tax=Magallana gigas TaxID=29159 RepID=UPI003342A46C